MYIVNYDLLRNGAGYVDLTAYHAIKNYQKEKETMEYKRGEIFEYNANGNDGRKALVVSADFRSAGRYLSVIVLSDEIKGENMIPVVCGGQMYADCGMVSFATNERLGSYIRTASAKEMQQIDEGICRCLGLEQKTVEVPIEKVVEVPAPVAYESSSELLSEDLATAKAEAKVYKELYEKLFEKMIG